MKKKIAVVLMNLGGPDSLKAVKPFLYNLFSDPRIINLPSPFRQMLAWLISTLRAEKAMTIYSKIGGKSPLLENTNNQATAIQKLLTEQDSSNTYQVFVAMRYWHPFTEEAAIKVRSFKPDKLILLPLYPQFSTTTSESSLLKWRQSFKDILDPIVTCCYPGNAGFIKAYQDLILKELKKATSSTTGKIRLLFSAHGLPQKIVDAGDPYPLHVNQSVLSIMDHPQLISVDYQICYQSRVGPLKWLKPSLEEEIDQASKDNKGVIVVPISFVSEHSETLVELDMDFREKATVLNLPYYGRVPTVSCHPDFIQGLANLVMGKEKSVKNCPPNTPKCWCQNQRVETDA